MSISGGIHAQDLFPDFEGKSEKTKQNKKEINIPDVGGAINRADFTR